MTRLFTRPVALLACLVVAAAFGCVPPSVQSTLQRQPTPAELRELWIDPAGQVRNLARGPGLHEPPRADARFEMLERDPRGFSITW